MAKKSRKTRRARGTGSIFFDARRQRWVGRVLVGRKPDGTPQYVTRSHSNQTELLKLLDGLKAPTARTTVADWSRRWLESLDLAPKTLDSYRLSVRDYLIPTLGNLPLATLTPHQIEVAARALLQDTPTRDGLNPNTVNLALAHLRTCLGAAVRAGLISTNPAASAKRPRGERKKIDPFTIDELRAIIAEASATSRTYIIAFLAATGARTGEAIALEVSDYDAAACTVSITKTYLNRRHGVGKVPKSANSVRTIRVPDAALPALRASLGDRTDGLLFPSKVIAGPKSHNAVRSPWVALLKRLGLRFRSVHQLRHTVASHLIAAGVPIGDVSAFLGDSPATIVGTYLRPIGADVAGAMGDLLGGRKSFPK